MYFGKSWISYFFLLPRIVVNEPIYDSKQLQDTYLIADLGFFTRSEEIKQQHS